jgi:hypothetical protein
VRGQGVIKGKIGGEELQGGDEVVGLKLSLVDAP